MFVVGHEELTRPWAMALYKGQAVVERRMEFMLKPQFIMTPQYQEASGP